MSVEAIIDTIQKYMHEKTNESQDSQEETKIEHVDRKEPTKNLKKRDKTKSKKSIVSDAGHQIGKNSLIVRQK